MAFTTKEILRLKIIKDNKELGKITGETLRYALENRKDINKVINELNQEGLF